jgi:hypothetical protein
MRNLTEDELAGIEQRAELCFRYGDTTALRPEDVADLLKEVRWLQQQNVHMVALYRQAHARLVEHIARYSGGTLPADDLEFP